MYQFRYYEETKTRDGGVRKSIRHTAVYHHQRAGMASLDYVIVLQPTEAPSFDDRLAWLGGSGDRNKADLSRLVREPLLFHRLLFSTCTPGWRNYARTLGDECSTEVGPDMLGFSANLTKTNRSTKPSWQISMVTTTQLNLITFWRLLTESRP